MDAFKNSETQRMEHGGNDVWKGFFDKHPVTVSEGRSFEDSTIKERYEGEVGEEYKERLAARVEGREFDPGVVQRNLAGSNSSKKGDLGRERSSTPLSGTGTGTGNGSGRGSPAEGGLGRSGSARKERNEAYFAKLGSENATRSATLPPSQGGKFTGFGGGLPVEDTARGGGGAAGGPGRGAPGFDDFQKDPMAALTKGFGWFTTAVGKGAKTMNDSYIQPTAKTVCPHPSALLP